MTNPSQESLIFSLRRTAMGFGRTQELYVTVKLGIADQLASGPMQAIELAQCLKVDQRALFRFLRLLVARNLLSQENDTFFA